jgi:hypothetical protein
MNPARRQRRVCNAAELLLSYLRGGLDSRSVIQDTRGIIPLTISTELVSQSVKGSRFP